MDNQHFWIGLALYLGLCNDLGDFLTTWGTNGHGSMSWRQIRWFQMLVDLIPSIELVMFRFLLQKKKHEVIDSRNKTLPKHGGPLAIAVLQMWYEKETSLKLSARHRCHKCSCHVLIIGTNVSWYVYAPYSYQQIPAQSPLLLVKSLWSWTSFLNIAL